MPKRLSASLLWLLLFILGVAAPVYAATPDTKSEFDALVKKTYNFKEVHEDNAEAVEKQVNGFWKIVTARKKEFLPLLRAAVADPKSNPFFRFDGSNLRMVRRLYAATGNPHNIETYRDFTRIILTILFQDKKPAGLPSEVALPK